MTHTEALGVQREAEDAGIGATVYPHQEFGFVVAIENGFSWFVSSREMATVVIREADKGGTWWARVSEMGL